MTSSREIDTFLDKMKIELIQAQISRSKKKFEEESNLSSAGCRTKGVTRVTATGAHVTNACKITQTELLVFVLLSSRTNLNTWFLPGHLPPTTLFPFGICFWYSGWAKAETKSKKMNDSENIAGLGHQIIIVMLYPYQSVLAGISKALSTRAENDLD